MFLGTYSPRLDDKGRLFLPAKFREQLQGGLVMTKGQERCLYVFAEADFEGYAAKVREAPLSAKKVRDYARVFFAGAAHDVPDRQGRIGVPPHLRTYAGLDRDCAVIGASSHVEIWAAATWDTYLAASEEDYADITEEVLPGIF